MPLAPHVRVALRAFIRTLNTLAIEIGLPNPTIDIRSSESDAKKLRRRLLLKLHADKQGTAKASPEWHRNTSICNIVYAEQYLLDRKTRIGESVDYHSVLFIEPTPCLGYICK